MDGLGNCEVVDTCLPSEMYRTSLLGYISHVRCLIAAVVISANEKVVLPLRVWVKGLLCLEMSAWTPIGQFLLVFVNFEST